MSTAKDPGEVQRIEASGVGVAGVWNSCCLNGQRTIWYGNLLPRIKDKALMLGLCGVFAAAAAAAAAEGGARVGVGGVITSSNSASISSRRHIGTGTCTCSTSGTSCSIVTSTGR